MASSATFTTVTSSRMTKKPRQSATSANRADVREIDFATLRVMSGGWVENGSTWIESFSAYGGAQDGGRRGDQRDRGAARRPGTVPGAPRAERRARAAGERARGRGGRLAGHGQQSPRQADRRRAAQRR